LIQPLQGRPAPLGAGNNNGQGLCPATARHADRPLRPGLGLLVASGASLCLWAGLAKLVLVVLR
jgi:hypothetical protein